MRDADVCILSRLLFLNDSEGILSHSFLKKR